MTKEKNKVVILLNDNDLFFSKVCRKKFQKDGGWECFISSDYNSALEKIEIARPNLIITELICNEDSEKTGFDLIKFIKNDDSEMSDASIVVFSDSTDESDKEKALSLGANYYFVKSEIEIKELIAKIKEIVEKF